MTCSPISESILPLYWYPVLWWTTSRYCVPGDGGPETRTVTSATPGRSEISTILTTSLDTLLGVGVAGEAPFGERHVEPGGAGIEIERRQRQPVAGDRLDRREEQPPGLAAAHWIDLGADPRHVVDTGADPADQPLAAQPAVAAAAVEHIIAHAPEIVTASGFEAMIGELLRR